MIGIVFNWHFLAASKHSIIHCLCDICDNEKKIESKLRFKDTMKRQTNGHVA